MKNVKEHCKADLFLLGFTMPFIHSSIDSAVHYLGPAHRYDNHDFRTVLLYKSLLGDDAANIALLHILLDFHLLDDDFVKSMIK